MPLVGGVILAVHFAPLRLVECGEKRIAVDIRVDQREVQTVCARQRKLINLRTANHHRFVRRVQIRLVRARQRGVRACAPP